jgi:hypothetical protein
MVRVFPALLFTGLLLRAVTRAVKARRISLSGEERRVLAGAGLAVVLLLPLGSVVAGDWHAWTAFVENAVKHASTPLTNYMGLKTVLAYDHGSRAELSAPLGLEEDPFALWKAARLRTFAERRYLFWAAAMLFLILLAAAVDRRPAWIAATLGVGAIAVLGEITGYYYSVFLIYAFVWPRRRLVGVALCALASLSVMIGLTAGWADMRYTGISLAFVLFVLLATTVFAFDGTRSDASATPST